MVYNEPSITPNERRLFESMEFTEKYQMYKSIPQACRGCPNHPINGGSGICNCTLGGMHITW